MGDVIDDLIFGLKPQLDVLAMRLSEIVVWHGRGMAYQKRVNPPAS